jgi:hypothetical protein
MTLEQPSFYIVELSAPRHLSVRDLVVAGTAQEAATKAAMRYAARCEVAFDDVAAVALSLSDYEFVPRGL